MPRIEKSGGGPGDYNPIPLGDLGASGGAAGGSNAPTAPPYNPEAQPFLDPYEGGMPEPPPYSPPGAPHVQFSPEMGYCAPVSGPYHQQPPQQPLPPVIEVRTNAGTTYEVQQTPSECSRFGQALRHLGQYGCAIATGLGVIGGLVAVGGALRHYQILHTELGYRVGSCQSLPAGFRQWQHLEISTQPPETYDAAIAKMKAAENFTYPYECSAMQQMGEKWLYWARHLPEKLEKKYEDRKKEIDKKENKLKQDTENLETKHTTLETQAASPFTSPRYAPQGFIYDRSPTAKYGSELTVSDSGSNKVLTLTLYGQDLKKWQSKPKIVMYWKVGSEWKERSTFTSGKGLNKFEMQDLHHKKVKLTLIMKPSNHIQAIQASSHLYFTTFES